MAKISQSERLYMPYSNEEYLIELLLEAGALDERAVQTARGTKKPNESVIDTLIKTGVVSDEQIAQNVAVNSGMEYVDLTGYCLLYTSPSPRDRG